MSQSTRNIIYAIGTISILAGLYMITSGKSFSQYFSSLFIGIVLIGAAYFQAKNTK